MSNKLDLALERLNSILPLKHNQEACGLEIKRLHQQLLTSFVTKGRPLSKVEMSFQVDDVEKAATALINCDIAMFSHDGNVIGAYPFSVIERDYLIKVNGHTLYAMCALDALAIAPMFNIATDITSRCAITGKSINIQMVGEDISNIASSKDVYLGVDWDSANTNTCCADSLCKKIVFFQHQQVAEQWLTTESKEGELFSLKEAVQFSSRFFIPLME
jgi:hypothetical protein